jgi:competence ComEA-like helix-hairpin-helix protein
MREQGSILVALLWCVALLAVMVVGALHASLLELRVVKNHGDQIQAHYLALAGVEKTKALLFHDAADRRERGEHHTGTLYDAPEHFRDVTLGRGQFRIIRQGRREEGGGILYGVIDEESRLNLNTASPAELVKLPDLTPQHAAAIMDYRDADSLVTPGGAEMDDYLTLKPPYLPRNAPLRTLREVLLVYGISRETFHGEDANLNGMLDPEENDGNTSYPVDNRDGYLDAGWSGWVTLDSEVRNVSAKRTGRADLQSADETTLEAVEGITPEIARAIVRHRGENRFESLGDLLEVRAEAPPSGTAPPQPDRGPTRPGSGPTQGPPAQPSLARSPSAPAGERVITQELLMEIADELKIGSELTVAGAVNINTAEAAVLACLPGITEELANAIVSYRQSAGYFQNIAWLLKVPGMSPEIFKQAAPRVSAGSETFRILSEGKIGSTGARKRIQVIVRIGLNSIDTLAYREDDL